jgi:hypothetical protein
MLRRTPFKSKNRPRETAERVYKTPSVDVERFRIATPVSDQVHAAPKENAVECEAYRRLVAGLPCINCSISNQSQAAHPPPSGKGRKEDDRMCFPLCCTRPGIPGCHVLFDQYKLMTHEAAVAQARVWAAQVRAVVLGFNAWPKNLPLWEEGEER